MSAVGASQARLDVRVRGQVQGVGFRPYVHGLAPFDLCGACRDEYETPGERRFHDEAMACPACGPRLALLDARGRAVEVDDVVGATVARLRDGGIVAIKGLGGFHLACDTRNADAVAALRARKHREARPLGLLALNAASLAPYAMVDDVSRTLLEAPDRPMVLLPRRPSCDAAFPGVAPGVVALGAMLPYAPVHYLLFHEWLPERERADRLPGSHWIDQPHSLVLVMTSANPSGEPIVVDDREAVERLAGIADAVMTHDRGIVSRCDDSVVQPRRGGAAFVRRARGHVPRGIVLPAHGPCVLALGGWLKSTACATRGDRAYLTPHVGDLGSVASTQVLEQAMSHLLQLLDVRPRAVAHDLHPDYPSTTLALRLANDLGVPAVGVQHHHAHVAAVAAEHGLDDEVLGVALDGVGLGTDGGAWGGELLRAGRAFERLGCLRPLALPGGDRAAREPWRMALGVLHALGERDTIATRYPGEAGTVLQQMLDGGIHCPPTSSAGRVFDAAAALLGIRDRNGYEAEAAMNLEALARGHGSVAPLAHGYRVTADNRLDFLPLLAELSQPALRAAPARGAALFHATFAAGLAEWVARSVDATGLWRVVLAGGCFLNAILSEALRARLEAAGLEVYEAWQAPPGDGGLSLGQAWVALMQARERS